MIPELMEQESASLFGSLGLRGHFCSPGIRPHTNLNLWSQYTFVGQFVGQFAEIGSYPQGAIPMISSTWLLVVSV
jgi:hypothetical protein